MPLIKVLYLDDEALIGEIFLEEFSTAEIQIMVFTDPQSAVAEANRNPPDLAILDYRLFGTTGDQIAQVLSPDITKYLISGESGIKTDYKFAGILTKPLNFEVIHNILNDCLKRKI